ncbi:MAG: DUF5050 domain-containing protein [Peptococcaceae bacterium]|nr:DUF5050 domain-containing protein [Peptococcaceae bacterium]
MKRWWLMLFLILLTGCASIPAIDSTGGEQMIEPIINEVKVTEQPLSEIDTTEDDLFAKNYRTREPLFDDKGGCYYYIGFTADSVREYLYYDKGDGQPIATGLPEYDWFSVGVVCNDALYVATHESLPAAKLKNSIIERYKDGNIETVFDTPVDRWYFSEEGIYYQVDESIYLMDYDGNNSTLIVDIPAELYHGENAEGFVVYRGSIWYINRQIRQNGTKQKSVSLWSYDLKSKAFTKFDMDDMDGMERINNGYLYFKRFNKKTTLWRFNIETFCEEQVSDLSFHSVNFVNRDILFLTSEEVYRINASGETKIMDKTKFGVPLSLTGITCHGDRIFISGGHGPFNNRVVEIDLNGNILKKIHEW